MMEVNSANSFIHFHVIRIQVLCTQAKAKQSSSKVLEMFSSWSSNAIVWPTSSRFNNVNFLLVTVFIILTTLVRLNKGYIHSSPQNIESNEIAMPYSDIKGFPKDDHLPRCHSESICSTLQTNAKGVQVTPLCRCRGAHKCSKHWDPFDGYSITQGSEQYKFCEKAPTLSVCSLKQIAYTSVMGYSKITKELVSSTDRIMCKCPENYNYEPAGHSYSELDEVDVFKAEYYCQRMTECKPMETCKAVSVNPDESFLVNPKCICPENLSCPTITNNEINSMPMGKGRIYLIRCQV
ncbi:hypothetical protein CHUAL_006839 [Chamberlinius hualienensis]